MLTSRENDVFFDNSLKISRACNKIIGLLDEEYPNGQSIKDMTKYLDSIAESLGEMILANEKTARAAGQ